MRRWIVVLMSAAVVAGCASGPRRPGAINHVVLFKLKDPARAGALIADCDRRVRTIPGVRSYCCGRPFETGREMVDSGFDVGVFISFDTGKAYRAYLSNPEHQALVREWDPGLEWVRIHDIGDETP